MKRILTTICAVAMSAALFSQSPLQVRELTLSNGMTVWLNEDHSQPKIYGGVVVRAGAKDCPDTGIAHYFEHIMFKGTDRIGTIDFEAERPWLDSISAQYDLLSRTSDDVQRTAIQQHINALSLKAADYAIPNEFSRLISKYGGTGLNAATGPDMTVYYNTFLPQYITQWCWLNSERLVSPVFRGFQSELENVYEEKNRASDYFGGALDMALKAVFKDQPYAYPILGSTESLKNPRLSDMEAFYKKYYVAPNMCLMLCGDITADSTLTTLLEQTFGRVPTGTVPTRTTSPMPAVKLGDRAEIKLPIPIIGAEALVYNAPTAFDADANAMRIACMLLSNGKAGMLDSLVNEHRVMMAGLEHIDDFSDAALAALYVIPKIPFGKMKKAEAACMSQLQRLMDGDFTEQQVAKLKQQYLMEAEQELETISGRAERMISVYASGFSWQDYLNQIEACRQVSKADVVRVAQKYFTANHLTLVKKYGTPKKETLSQPGYAPVTPKNATASSAYAEWLAQMPVGSHDIRTVDFAADASCCALNPHATLYHKQNAVNDIFDLTLRYYNGTRAKPLLTLLDSYLNYVGTDSLKKQQLEAAWLHLGVTMTVDAGTERVAFHLTGRDAQLQPALELLAHFLGHAAADDEALKTLKQEAKVNDKSFGEQKDDVLSPMLSYVCYGVKSDYLRQPSLKEVKAVTCDTLLALLRDLQQYECDILYSGGLAMNEVAALSQKTLPLGQCHTKAADTHRTLQASAEPVVYFYHVPKSRQNYVCSYEQLPPQDSWAHRATAELWAQYMGGGMSGALFQNIREFQSLAYATQGQLLQPNYARHADDPLAFITVTGTQADKTMQVVSAVDSLLRLSSVSTENFEAARHALLSSIQNSYPDFRHVATLIANQQRNGYAENPDRQRAGNLLQTRQDDVERFGQTTVVPNSRVWLVIGDRKKTDLEALQRYGRLVELRKADIYR